MKQKQYLRIEIKEISESGTFEGILSPYNLVDLGKDLVEPGAFTKTMLEHGNEVPLLWQHNPADPIGKLVLEDGPDALCVKGQLLMDLPEAQKAYLLIKSRIVKGLSIGYKAVKSTVEAGVRHLKECRLWEGSIVTFPMAEQAMITAVKAAENRETKEDFNTELAEIQLQDMGYQMFCALRYALGSLPWSSGLSKDEKVAAAEATLQQFSEAFLAYLPAYLDYLTEEYGEMKSMTQGEIDTKRMERKAGRKISSATKESIKSACEQMKGAHDLLLALIADEAVSADPEDDTLDEKGVATPLDSAAVAQGKTENTSEAKAAAAKPEPESHSAVLSEIQKLKEAFIQWNQ